MATNAKLPPPPSSNGVITGPPKGVVGGNRKKQKRRAKQAAKVAAQTHSHSHQVPQPGDLEYDEDPLGYGEEDEYDYSETEHYHDQYLPPHAGSNGYNMPPAPVNASKKSKKKGGGAHGHSPYNPELLGNSTPPLPNPPPPPPDALAQSSTAGRGTIWNTSSQQERQNIKDFWLSLSEDERKSLLKIEKEAVLRKMKQQQKHSCSCTVCGRKRTAIEEELEVLYEGYYEELEQYAHHDHPPLPSTDGMMPDPLQHRRPPHPLAAPPPNPHHRTSQLQEHFDEDSFSEVSEEEDEEYSDDEDEYSSSEGPEALSRVGTGVPDFFNFGQNLTVKGILTPWLEKLQIGLKGNADNLLTVADDLLKNDGRKFIEMMEQLAERRMARETEAEFAAGHPSHPGGYPGGHGGVDGYGEDPLAAGEEFDDDEASYDSQEEYDDELDEEDEMGGLSEEQRMQEGRRMFQIFAARMFEQRVLTAYKEKVAAERQQKLLEELEDETKAKAQQDAKKQRDAQKKKDKKKQQQQAKAEEKAKKDAEKAAEEAKIKEAEERKLEEQRRKKEEQRKKKEDERKKQEDERARKEAEKTRKQAEDQQRKDEAERKAREQRAAEKAKKDEAKKREREEREAREKEARERKSVEEKEKKEREAKAKAEKEAREREKSTQVATQPPVSQQQQPLPQIQKRPSQPGMVAVPGLPKQSTSGLSSPHPPIATPAIPKASTPAKQRQASHQGSLASSPKQSASQVSSVPSKSSSPNSAGAPQQPQQQPQAAPKTIMQKPGNQQPPAGQPPQHATQANSPPNQQPIQPPPGMPQHQQQQYPGFGGMPQMGFSGFQGQQGPIMQHNMGQRGPMPGFQHQAPPIGVHPRFGPGMNNMSGPPPGMMPPPGRGFPFDQQGPGQVPPGFGAPQTAQQQPHQTPLIGQPPISAAPGGETSRSVVPSHSRQHSASDKEKFEFSANQPIARPAPIQRPSSVKPPGDGSSADVDDLSKHLGSSALLDDSDEPIPTNLAENRRQSTMQAPGRPAQAPGLPTGGSSFGAPGSGFGAPGSSWNTPSLPFGQSSGLGQQNWGTLPNAGMSGWSNNNSAFSANSGFGPIGGSQMHRPGGTGLNRPLNIRLAVCQACKQLTQASRGEGDGFHVVDVLLRQIDANRPPLDSPPTLREIEEICETEGDSQNGGGELHVRKIGAADKFAVKWAPAAGTPDQGRGALAGLGEIGSPLPHKPSPSGFGAPGMGRGLGAVGSPSF